MAEETLKANLLIDTSKAEASLNGVKGKLQNFGKVASTVGKGIGIASAAIGGAAVGAFKFVDNYTKAADAIDEGSQRVGLSAKAYQEWDHVLKMSGTSIDSLEVGSKKLTQSMASAQEGGESQIAIFQRLGVAYQNQDGSLKSLNEVLPNVITALSAQTNETERNAMANELLGKSGTSLIPVFNMGEEAINKEIKALNESGAVMSGPAISAGVSFQDMMSRLKATLNGVFANLATDLIPCIEDLVKSLMPLLPVVVELIKNIIPLVKQIMPLLVDIIKMLVPMVGDLIKALIPIISILFDIIKSLLPIVKDIIPLLVSLLKEVVCPVLLLVAKLIETVLVPALLFIVNTVRKVVEESIKWIKSFYENNKEKFEKIAAVIKNFVEESIKWIKSFYENNKEKFEKIFEVIKKVWDDVVKVFKQVWNDIELIFKGVWKTVTGIWDTFKALFKGDWEGVWNGIKKTFSGIWDIIVGQFKVYFDIIVGQLKIYWDMIVGIFGDAASKIWTSVTTWISNVGTSIKNFAIGIKDFFVNLPSEMKQIGINMIKGIWNGIISLSTWLANGVKNFVSDYIVDPVKKFLHIGSPSKLMEEIGEWTVAGFAEGLRKTSPVRDAIEDMNLDLQTGFETMIPSIDWKKWWENSGWYDYRVGIPNSVPLIDYEGEWNKEQKLLNEKKSAADKVADVNKRVNDEIYDMTHTEYEKEKRLILEEMLAVVESGGDIVSAQIRHDMKMRNLEEKRNKEIQESLDANVSASIKAGQEIEKSLSDGISNGVSKGLSEASKNTVTAEVESSVNEDGKPGSASNPIVGHGGTQIIGVPGGGLKSLEQMREESIAAGNVWIRDNQMDRDYQAAVDAMYRTKSLPGADPLALVGALMRGGYTEEQARAVSLKAAANMGIIPKFAKGGIAKKPTFGIFGEQGPEALVPLKNRSFGQVDTQVIQIFLDGKMIGQAAAKNLPKILKAQGIAC